MISKIQPCCSLLEYWFLSKEASQQPCTMHITFHYKISVPIHPTIQLCEWRDTWRSENGQYDNKTYPIDTVHHRNSVFPLHNPLIHLPYIHWYFIESLQKLFGTNRTPPVWIMGGLCRSSPALAPLSNMMTKTESVQANNLNDDRRTIPNNYSDCRHENPESDDKPLRWPFMKSMCLWLSTDSISTTLAILVAATQFISTLAQHRHPGRWVVDLLSEAEHDQEHHQQK